MHQKVPKSDFKGVKNCRKCGLLDRGTFDQALKENQKSDYSALHLPFVKQIPLLHRAAKRSLRPTKCHREPPKLFCALGHALLKCFLGSFCICGATPHFMIIPDFSFKILAQPTGQSGESHISLTTD